MEDSSTGQAAPTPIPSVIGNADANVIAPVTDNACKIPMEADALCSTAVKAIPTRIPINGFENMVSVLTKCGFSFNGETAPLMLCMPNISMENPSIISPTFLYVLFLEIILNKIPMIETTAEMVVVDNSCAMPPDPSI